MKVFVINVGLEAKEVADVEKAVHLEIILDDGSKLRVYEKNNALVVYGDGRIAVEPHAANMVGIRDLSRS